MGEHLKVPLSQQPTFPMRAPEKVAMAVGCGSVKRKGANLDSVSVGSALHTHTHMHAYPHSLPLCTSSSHYSVASQAVDSDDSQAPRRETKEGRAVLLLFWWGGTSVWILAAAVWPREIDATGTGNTRHIWDSLMI